MVFRRSHVNLSDVGSVSLDSRKSSGSAEGARGGSVVRLIGTQSAYLRRRSHGRSEIPWTMSGSKSSRTTGLAFTGIRWPWQNWTMGSPISSEAKVMQMSKLAEGQRNLWRDQEISDCRGNDH